MNNKENYYDLSFLNQMMSNDKKEVTRMIKIFLETAPEILSKLNQGLSNNDMTDVHQYAHKLKSSIDIFKITELTDVIREIEKNSKENNNLNDIPSHIEKVNQVIEKVLVDIDKEINP